MKKKNPYRTIARARPNPQGKSPNSSSSIAVTHNRPSIANPSRVEQEQEPRERGQEVVRAPKVQDPKTAVLAKLMGGKESDSEFFLLSGRTKATVFVMPVSFRFVSLVQDEKLICF
jgi:hypothetical protein